MPADIPTATATPIAPDVPPHGGTWMRDPDTGALTLQHVTAEADAAPAEAAPADPTPAA